MTTGPGTKHTCALGADPLDSAGYTVSAASVCGDVNTILGLWLKPDDGGLVQRAVHRVVDAAARRRRSDHRVVVIACPGIVDLVAADHAVQFAVKRRLPLDADRRRVDRLHADTSRLTGHCDQSHRDHYNTAGRWENCKPGKAWKTEIGR